MSALMIGCFAVASSFATAFDLLLDEARLALGHDDWIRARLALEEAVRLGPSDPDALMMLAQIEERERRWPEAALLYERAIEAAGSRERVRLAQLRLAVSLNEAGEWRRAEGMLEELLAETTTAEVLFHLGRARERQGNYAAAHSAYRHILTFATDDVAALAGVGRCLLALGKPRSARRAFERAVQLAPEEPEARYHLALLARDGGEGRLREVDELLAAAVEEDPGDLEAWLMRARVAAARGDALAAAQFVGRAGRLDPRAAQRVVAADRELAAAVELARGAAAEIR